MNKNITISADILSINNDIYHDYYYNYKKRIFSKSAYNSDNSLRHIKYLESIKELSIEEEKTLECLLCKIFKKIYYIIFKLYKK